MEHENETEKSIHELNLEIETVKSSHGGRRPGAGRKKAAQRKKSFTIWLTAEEEAKVRELGGGKVQAGVRRLLSRRYNVLSDLD